MILEVLSSETPRSSHDVHVKLLAFSFFALFFEQLSFEFFFTPCMCPCMGRIQR